MKFNFYLATLLVGFSFLLLVITGTYYEVPDNALIAWLIQGKISNVQIDSFPRFLIWIPHVLIPLYKAFPEIPWYGLLLEACLGISLFTFLILVFQTVNDNTHKILIGVILSGLFFESFMYPDFSRVGLLLTMAGGFLLMEKTFSVNKLITVLVLIILGGLFRVHSLNFGIVFLIPSLLLFWPKEWKQTACLLVLFIVLKIILIPSTDYNLFLEWNRTKSMLLDFGQIDLNEIELSKTVKSQLTNWYFNDEYILEDVFPRLKENINPFNVFKTKNIGTVVYNFFSYDLKKYSLLILALILLINKKPSTRKIIYGISIFILLFLISLFLKSVDKTTFTILFGCLFILLTKTNPSEFSTKHLSLFTGLCLVIILFTTYKRVDFAKTQQSKNEALLSQLDEHNAKTVLGNTRNFKLYLNPLKTYSIDLNNYYPMVGWYSVLPEIQDDLHKQFGYKYWNKILPYNELYLLTKKPGELVIFYSEAHNIALKIEKVNGNSNSINKDLHKIKMNE